MKSGTMLSLSDVAAMTGGRLLGVDGGVARVISDSRTASAGELFVALKGERFDGHDFVDAVLDKGGTALIDDRQAARFHGKAVVAVPDTLQALGALAKRWRQRFTLPVVAVVGSNGKTTVKEMIAAILDAHWRRRGEMAAVLATQGNLNNAIGLPLTLLGLRDGHRGAVIELGMNHRGETATLASWTAPDVVVINNAQREHQEFMKSVDEVAREHGDALDALRAGGCAVLNVDDAHCAFWRDKTERRGRSVLSFGMGDAADVRGAMLADGGMRVTARCGSGEKADREAVDEAVLALPLPGAAMAMNALAALATALRLGVPLQEGAAALTAFRGVEGRLAVSSLDAHWTLIDDSYNANPDSVRAAIDVLATRNGERWLILGDMGEVGDAGADFHREVGAYAGTHGIQRLLTLGELSHHAGRAFAATGNDARHFETSEALAAALLADVGARKDAARGDGTFHGTILIKGSRFMRMERIAAAVRAAFATAASPDDAKQNGISRKDSPHAALAH